MHKMNYFEMLVCSIIINLIRTTILVSGCGSTVNNQIVTNPTLSWTMNPPVAWTYPSATAIQEQSFLPGQSLTQIQAQNTANGDISAATIQAISAVGLSTAGLTARATYTPPQVNDCIKVGTGAQASTVIGDTFGIVEQGAVVYLATTSAAITNAVCVARSFTNTITLAPFIQSASVSIQGLTVSMFQLSQIAARMMVQLNFNNNVRFVTEIIINTA